MIAFDATETGGWALLVGYLVVFLVLYRDPASGLAAALSSTQSLLFFLVLPTVGFLVGVYAVLDGPYSGGALFLLGSYLGIFAVGLTLGTLLSTNPFQLTLLVGGVLLVLSVVALLGSIARLAEIARLPSTPVEPD